MSNPKLVPELLVSDFEKSRQFYVEVIGCNIRYDRPAQRFAYLELDGVHLMIEQESDFWETGKREYPYGRGISLQIEVTDLDGLLRRIEAAGLTLFRPVEEAWYRAGDVYEGNRQFLVQDPDGYLLRFFQDLGAANSPRSGRIVG
ncbi:bleomycin resistance protein [Dongia soli]|uniref:Bleomycin resistance protein n=1 Tax=Dongia soli TaxID=600628 RepID=A0ABU5ECD9_9PROT|nr:VOC family protein [Dongia soli]MDY0883098.1 VOC family protein [Dongia soli]